MKTQFVAKALSRAEMKKITGGTGPCVPDDGTQRCILAGGTISCSEIPCCCDAVCIPEFNGTDFVDVCRAL